MQRHWTHFLFFFLVLLVLRPVRAQSPNGSMSSAASANTANHSIVLRKTRKFAHDLEVGGNLAGLQPGATRFLSREDLLALPQVTYTRAGDTNFADSDVIGGVRLEDLARRLDAAPASDMIVAICDDEYRANYPRAYLAAHHPVLVLTVNGLPPEGWPKDAYEHQHDMGPFMISQANFVPTFKILAHTDEPQIPWGVVRLEFRDEKTLYDAIAPAASLAANTAVQAGYQIARQNCFKCHNAESEGGQKSGLTWAALAKVATDSPKDFGTYIRNPISKNPRAQMPPNPSYDDGTIKARTTYVETFRSA